MMSKSKRGVNEKNPRIYFYGKRRIFGYLFEIARGVWGIQNGK